MSVVKSRCWPASRAETKIHAYAEDWSNLDVVNTDHAKDQMSERQISVTDVRAVLRYGHITEGPKAASRGQCIYKICGKTPNSANRKICAVVIPNLKRPAIKIITVMWPDE